MLSHRIGTVVSGHSLDIAPAFRADNLSDERPVEDGLAFLEVAVMIPTKADDVSQVPVGDGTGAGDEMFGLEDEMSRLRGMSTAGTGLWGVS